MYKQVIATHEEQMKKTVSFLKEELGSIRAGRANPKLVEKLQISYYGTMTPINQVANISVPEPRCLLIQPWDSSTIKEIEKAIMNSDLGINPSNDGKIIRLMIPQLTEERRRDLLKLVKKDVENSKVVLRNIRRDIIDEVKKLEKSSEITKDDLKKAEEDTQKLTDKYIKLADDIYKDKEKEILEV